MQGKGTQALALTEEAQEDGSCQHQPALANYCSKLLLERPLWQNPIITLLLFLVKERKRKKKQ